MCRPRWVAVIGTLALCVLWAFWTTGVGAEAPKPRRPLLTNTSVGKLSSPYSLSSGTSASDDESAAINELLRSEAEAERALASLQAGPPCARIRDASRVSLRARFLAEHERELSVAGALLLSAGLIAMFVGASRARTLLATPPLVGAAFLGYVAWERLDVQRTALREGLRACTAELPAADARQPARLLQRRARAQALTATIRRVSEADHELTAP